MDWIVWAILTALIWTNNEILEIHGKNGTRPSWKFWISTVLSAAALIGWLIWRLK